ncbi:hypothetical protein J7M23_12845 [Candidatus Sumerlaeota bacterium]|nr:hypothetical protein [Candidatus Sumerlaeota bacterium]
MCLSPCSSGNFLNLNNEEKKSWVYALFGVAGWRVKVQDVSEIEKVLRYYSMV